MTMMPFIQKIERLADARGYSERALAKEVGFDQSAVSRWRERGSKPRRGLAKRLAAFFGVPLDVLLDDQRDIPIGVFLADGREDADQAKRAFPRDDTAMEAIFTLKDARRARQRENARLANILRKQEDALRKIADILKKQAASLDLREI